MHRFFIPACLSILVLVGCEADDSLVSDEVTESLKVQSDEGFSRSISLYLEPQQTVRFTPDFNGRVIFSEPVYTVPTSAARAQRQVDGINVVYVGKSCESLRVKYQDLYDCVEEETVKFEYGETESTAETDSEGFAAMLLGSAEVYRLRVQSWAAREDGKCYWGGEETVTDSQSEVKIPLLVFCE